MPDLAMLGIKVDSRDVKVADKDLDKLAHTAGKTEKATNELGKEADKTNKRFAGLSTALSAVTISMASMVAAGAGVVTMAGNLARFGREMEVLSKLAGTSSEQFQAMTYAADRHNISAEKMADIYKDVQDKVGDFIQTGGGAMADFFEQIAPKVGVTADEFRRLSGPDALQLYYSSLEKANLSQADLVFYMEAIASDATALIPLLRDNGKEFNRLTEEARQLGIVMDDVSTKNAAKFNENLGTMRVLLRDIGNDIGNEFIPTLNRLAEEFIDARRAGMGFWEAITGIGLSDPSKSPGQQVRQIGEEIENLRKKLDQPHTSRARVMIQSEIEELTKLREYFKNRQRSEALAGGENYGNESRMSSAVLPFNRVQTTGRASSGSRASSALRIEQEELTAFQQELIDAFRESASVYEQTRTPLERLNAEYEKLDRLLELGVINQETHSRAIGKSIEAYNKANGAMVAWDDSMVEIEQANSHLETALVNSFNSIGDAIANFATGGKVSVRDMVNAMIQDFIRLEMRMLSMKMFEQFGGASGILKSLFGGLTGGAGAIDTSFTTGLGSAATSGAMDYAAMSFDGGGYTGGGNRTGGIDGKGGFPAILHPNETVIDHTKGQTGGVSVSITINSDGTGREESGSGNQAMQLGRSIEASVMSVIMREKRPGGMLA